MNHDSDCTDVITIFLRLFKAVFVNINETLNHVHLEKVIIMVLQLSMIKFN